MELCFDPAPQLNGGGEKRARLEPALRVKRLTDNAILPTRGSPHAAGYDLYRCEGRFFLSPSLYHPCSASDVCVPAQGKVIVPTDLAMAIPDGCYGRIGSSPTSH